jgi:hypothetical protein
MRGFPSLCEGCVHVRVITSDTGSRFLLCGKSREDPRFSKYPPQPVLTCPAHRPATA